MIDRLDVLVVVGLALLGVAVWLWWGLPAVLAFAGGVLLTVGVLAVAGRALLAHQQAARVGKQDKPGG